MGERSIQEKYQAWRKCPGMNEELHNQLKAMSPDELNDSFYRSLAFGTGGLRGVLGAGENRMNLYTVSKATRGLGRYLLETCEKPSCAGHEEEQEERNDREKVSSVRRRDAVPRKREKEPYEQEYDERFRPAIIA